MSPPVRCDAPTGPCHRCGAPTPIYRLTIDDVRRNGWRCFAPATLRGPLWCFARTSISDPSDFKNIYLDARQECGPSMNGYADR